MTVDKDANSSEKQPIITRMAVIASVFALAGCPATVYAPATELPKLEPKALARMSDWPVVTTTAGYSQKIQGEIDAIRIVHGRGREPIPTRFKALVEGHELQVESSEGLRAFSLAENPHLEIDYTDRNTPRVIGGLAMIVAGVPLAIGGVAAFSAAADASDGRGLEQLGAPIFGILGVAGLGGGLGLIGGGIYLIAKDSKKPVAGYATVAPTLQVGPRGANLTVKF